MVQPVQEISGGNIASDPPPWIGAMYLINKAEPICTAEFITDQWLITAKHCIEKKDISSLYVAYTGGIIFKKTRVIKVIRLDNPKAVYTDIALVKLERAIPIARLLPLFHGYSFNPYMKHEKVKIYGYGSLGLDSNGKYSRNLQSILKVGYEKIVGFLYDTFMLEVAGGEEGYTAPGDSGGPLLLKTSSANEQFRVAGVLSLGEAVEKHANFVMFSSDILKAIALNAYIPIFKYPLENAFATLDDNNNLGISGWGPHPFALKVIALDRGLEVASCKSADFNEVLGNEWQCKAKFSNLVASAEGNYEAEIIDKDGKIGDSVAFKANIDPDLEIISPKSGETYTALKGSTYLVAGKGIPRANVTYLLENLKTDSINKSPCSNSGSNTISLDGQWQCRIEANIKETTNYRITISYEPAAFDTDANHASNKIATTDYIVSPIHSPNIQITQPVDGAEVESSAQMVTVKIDNLEVNKNLELTVYTKNGANANFYQLSPVDSMAGMMVDIKDTDSSWNPRNIVKIKAKVYINNDESPIIQANSQYTSLFYEITFQRPIVDTIFDKQEATFKGMASKNLPIVVTGRLKDSLGQNQTLCNAKSDNNGNWQCVAEIDSLAAGIYDLSATLYKDSELAHAAASASQSLGLNSSNVQIKKPCCCGRCTIS